jgi:type II secretory pathway pseudopilin PulG
LLELLVASLIASVLVAVLLTFLTGILESNRIEEAKAATQDEVQSALRYIADDLQEAVYIYDADAVTRDVAQGGIRDVLRFADDTDRIPVLVFWKRAFLPPTFQVQRFNDANPDWLVGCLDYDNQSIGPNPNNCRNADGSPKGRGKFRYSLVSYYLQKNNPSEDVWSNAARIIRFELRDGVVWNCFNGATAPAGASGCPPIPPVNVNRNNSYFIINPDPGFAPFDLSGGGDIKARFNAWRPAGFPTFSYAGAPASEVLLDFVDDTPFVTGQDTGGAPNSAVRIDVGPNTTIPSGATTLTVNQNCSDPDRGVGIEGYLPGTPRTHLAQRIPGQFVQSVNLNRAREISSGVASGTYTSFYVCVANSGTPNRTSARVWIRANYRVRLQPNINFRRADSTELVTGSTTVLGRGLFNIDS